MLIVFRSRYVIDKLKKDLSFEFDMKDLGEANKVLGIEIERNRKSGKVCLTQKGYLKKVLQKFNINSNTKSVSILLAPHFKLKAIYLQLLLKSMSIYLMYLILAQLVVNVCNGVYEACFITSCLDG